MSGQYKYRAFISYSHTDEKWATWLHRALETYKIPKHLVGKETDYGPVPEKLAPIFRDRDELATSTELGGALTEALQQSACQIVICSPNAAKSRWTNEEILTFKRLHSPARIYCLIIDGEPGASQSPDTADQECFPHALRYQMGPDGELTDELSEPIAADARPGKDNKLNAKLKLIAGMIGVGFDDLKQREQHRRHQRMVAVTVAAAIGMAITTGLAATAWFARIEADAQRVRAEAEAETAKQTTNFMVDLFKVSDPSEARGNTITAREILDKGAERIDTELADQPEIQATLMDTMGSVYQSLGLYPEASDLLNNALTKRRAELGDEHADVAQSLAHLAEVLSLQAKYEDAEPMYREALDTQRRLLGDEAPEVAFTLVGFADLFTMDARFDEAEELFRESLEIRLKILGEEHMDVAMGMEYLGMNLFDEGDYSAAEIMMRDSIAMRKRLLKGSPHPELADGLNNLGLVLMEKGDIKGAQLMYQEALDMNRILLDESHPDIAVNLNNLALLHHDNGNYESAETLYREVIEIRQKSLGEEHPEVALAMSNLAYLLYDSGNREAAIVMQRQAVDVYRRIFPEGHPDLASSLGSLGSWLTNAGNYVDAEPLLHESVDMRKRLLGEEHAQVAVGMTALARFYLATGRIEEAASLSGTAREVLTTQLSKDHWRTAWAASVEGSSLAHLQKFEAAEKMLLNSHAALKEGPGSGGRTVYVQITSEYLADLYTTWGKPDLAKKYLAMPAGDESR